jgi:4-hydroxy-tetrahydrodipicolinate synthase
MNGFGAILTAIVTPFGSDGRVDEQALVSLLRHLADNGSDGAVVTGTTGEAATLDDDEHLGVVALAVAERPRPEFTIIAGVGSNDTRHATKLTARACELGVDALLSVNPYYNRPSPAGIVAHFTEVSRAADRPIILYNIPQRTGSDMSNELLARLAQLDHVAGVKQANNANLALIDGLALYAGNDEILDATLDLGGAGGILVASHLVGPALRRMVDEPAERAAIAAQVAPLLTALGIAPAAVTTKAALGLLGRPVGPPRLPYVELTPEELSIIRTALTAQGLMTAGASA